MEELRSRFLTLLSKLKVEEKQKEIRELEEQALVPAFWKDHKKAAEQMKTLSILQKELKEIEALSVLIDQGKSEEAEKLLTELETLAYLSDPYDEGPALVSIHSGQGGVEAMDWAKMLFRMYSRFFEKKGWEQKVIDQTLGEEAGIKSVTVSVEGRFAYGYLKGEAGVHRLGRQSPFNADNLRQTSFALVEVLPHIDTQSIKVKEDDLEWQFFRASSHGGQNVQKVSSAVRLRHKPTSIVITAQSERYQNQNREYALKILFGKLWALQEEEKKKEEALYKGGYKTPGWGNQIRSYVLHPYHMVKDLRTNYETSNTQAVLDGDLDGFIESQLAI